MHTSFYIGALTAITAMGKFLNKDVSSYEAIAMQTEKMI